MMVMPRALGPASANLQRRKPREVEEGGASEAMGVWSLSLCCRGRLSPCLASNRGDDEPGQPIAIGGTGVAQRRSIVLPSEGDAGAVAGDEPAVGDGDAVGIARQIGQHGLWAAKRTLGIRDRQAGVSAHASSQLCDASSGAEHRHQSDPGLVRKGDILPANNRLKHASLTDFILASARRWALGGGLSEAAPRFSLCTNLTAPLPAFRRG